MFVSEIINGTKFCLTLLYFRVREYFFSLNSKVCNLVHVLIARFINAGIGTWRWCFGDIGHT